MRDICCTNRTRPESSCHQRWTLTGAVWPAASLSHAGDPVDFCNTTLSTGSMTANYRTQLISIQEKGDGLCYYHALPDRWRNILAVKQYFEWLRHIDADLVERAVNSLQLSESMHDHGLLCIRFFPESLRMACADDHILHFQDLQACKGIQTMRCRWDSICFADHSSLETREIASWKSICVLKCADNMKRGC